MPCKSRSMCFFHLGLSTHRVNHVVGVFIVHTSVSTLCLMYAQQLRLRCSLTAPQCIM